MAQLDPDSQRFQDEVDSLVRRWASGDDRAYVRRWKQLGSWSINKTQGDVIKKAALKKRLIEKVAGSCEDCGKPFAAAALQMHRLDQELAFDRASNFGYVETNVLLVCASCHEARESQRRSATR